jgi:hypothetical protein
MSEEVVRKTDRQEIEAVQSLDEATVQELEDQRRERLEIERQTKKRIEDRRMG